MFDPYGKSVDKDVIINDDASDRNKNNKRKRQLVHSEEYARQEQQKRIALTLSPDGMLLNRSNNSTKSSSSNSSNHASRGLSIGDGYTNDPAVASGPASSHGQSSFSARFPPMPSLLDDGVGMGSSSTFGHVKSSTALGPLNDPLRQLLQSSSNDGVGSNSPSAPSGKINGRSPAGIQSNSTNDKVRAKQLSTLPPIAAISNHEFTTTASIAPFQLGGLPLDSGFRNNYEPLRNFQFQQQQIDREYAFTSLMSNNSNNNSLNPFQVPPNSIAISQALVPKSLVPHLNTGIQSSISNLTTENEDSYSTDYWNPSRARKAAGNESSRGYNCNGGRSQPLYLPCDAQTLSEYQCLLRKQIELFEATEEDIESSTKGRNKPIFLGQVGVRCIHCRSIKPAHRARGATYYPATLGAMYQSGQTMAIRHLRHHCTRVPLRVRERLFMLKDGKSSAGGGKKYWSDAASVMGVCVSEEGGLKFRPSSSAATRKDAAKRSNANSSNDKTTTTT